MLVVLRSDLCEGQYRGLARLHGREVCGGFSLQVCEDLLATSQRASSHSSPVVKHLSSCYGHVARSKFALS